MGCSIIFIFLLPLYTAAKAGRAACTAPQCIGQYTHFAHATISAELSHIPCQSNNCLLRKFTDRAARQGTFCLLDPTAINLFIEPTRLSELLKHVKN